MKNIAFKLKNDENAFFLKIYNTDKTNPFDLYNMLPKYLGKQSKLQQGFAKKSNNENLAAGMVGAGKDHSFPISEYVLLQNSVKKDDDVSHSLEIHFKMAGDIDDNIKTAVDFFSHSIWSCFNQPKNPIKYQLRSSKIYSNIDDTDILTLPCMKSSLGFLFKYTDLKHSQIVTMLKDADQHWLSILFSQEYNSEDQAELFGNKSTKELYLEEGEDGITLLKYLAKGGDIMKTQQEEFISMLIRIDKQENPEETGGAGRVIGKLKEGLQSSSPLTMLIKSVRSKHPITSITLWSDTINSFFMKIAKGLGFIFADIGTDMLFTLGMWYLYKKSLEHEEEPEDCQHVQDLLAQACNILSPVSGSMKCEEKLKEVFYENGTCSSEEVDRFAEPTDWLMMSIISRAHMLIPILMYIICSITIAIAKKDWMKEKWNIFGTFPPVAKIRMFLLEKDLYKSMAETDPGGQQIKDCKGKIDDYEDSVTLALLIEASCESSFQFFFQTLYRFGINIKFIKGKLY